MRKGWKEAALGDFVADFIVPQRDKPKEFGGTIPWCRIEDIEGIWLSHSKSGKCVTEAAVREMPLRVFPAGTVIVSCSADLGRCAIVAEPLVTNQTFIGLVPKASLDAQFLFYLMTSRASELNAVATGATIKYLSQDKFRGLSVQIPSLAEQRRIVGVLDEAFAGIATAEAHAERNLQNARSLLEGHLQSVFTQRGKGWRKTKLGDIAEFKNGLNFSKRSKGQRLRIVGVGDFQDNAVVPTEALQSVTIDGTLSDEYLIRRDDILTVRSNGSKDLVGRCMLVPEMDGKTSYSGFIIRIRFDATVVSPRFLLRYMKSSETRVQLTREGGGANISNINQAKLSELRISLPSFRDQEDIADRLDAISIETQRLQKRYQQKHAALAELKKSLLHQAFSGEL